MSSFVVYHQNLVTRFLMSLLWLIEKEADEAEGPCACSQHLHKRRNGGVGEWQGG